MRQPDLRTEDQPTHTFRGRSMQEAVRGLKAALGPDAVIVGTRRGRDPRGRYVEITAVGDPRPPRAPKRAAAPVADPADPPAMGGRRGASAAYARTARVTQPAELPPLLAALRGDPPDEKPFAERAAWLARQIEVRTAEHAAEHAAERAAERSAAGRTAAGHTVAEYSAAQTRAAAPGRPPYHTVADAPSAGSRILSPAEAAAELARPAGVEQLRAEIDALKALVAGLAERDTPVQTQLADIRALLAQVAGPAEAAASEIPASEIPAPEAPAPDAPDPVAARLVEAGVPAPYADDIARRCRPASRRPIDPETRLAEVLADDIDCGGGALEDHRVLAFVGPTGVGKTTTVAKLAARARLAGRRVALVTVDTFRMAAVDQLARYAEVLDAPLRVVKSPEALAPTLEALAGYDLVLVDTTGRNPRASGQVAALARFFPEGWGGELVLTVAQSTRERDAFATIDAFSALGCGLVCVTKTDESDAPGAIYGIARRAGRPVAWLTDGQVVPDDLEDARAPAIAARIMAHRPRTVDFALGA